MADSISSEEKPPLVIYRTSNDEIELHFTSEALETVKDVIFLAPDGNGNRNPAVILSLGQYDGAIHPSFRVYTDAAYTIDEYNGEMEYSIENNTLICHIRHEDIAAVFHKVTLWHIDTAKPVSFDGVITDDLTDAVYKPPEKGILPTEYKRSEYDEHYLTPDSDDFIILSYEMPVHIYEPTWSNKTGVISYGAYTKMTDSTVKITYLISFDKDTYLSTKIRTEYKTIDEAMRTSIIFDHDIVPTELGLPDKVDDSLVTADFFEESDLLLFGNLSELNQDAVYHGHFDQYRYFEFKAQDTAYELKSLVSVPLVDGTDTLADVPLASINYTAGQTGKSELISYISIEATIYSSKRSNQAGGNEAVLDKIYALPGDNQYFTPLTDDYAYIIKEDIRDSDAYEEGFFEQIVELYSFDESGNVVQWIYRKQHADYLNDNFEGEEDSESYVNWTFDKASGAYYIDLLAEYGGDYSGDEMQTDKQYLENDLLRYAQHEGYYFSKP